MEFIPACIVWKTGKVRVNSIITTEFLVFRVGVFRFTEVSSDFIPFFLGVLRVECFKCCSPEGIIFLHK